MGADPSRRPALPPPSAPLLPHWPALSRHEPGRQSARQSCRVPATCEGPGLLASLRWEVAHRGCCPRGGWWPAGREWSWAPSCPSLGCRPMWLSAGTPRPPSSRGHEFPNARPKDRPGFLFQASSGASLAAREGPGVRLAVVPGVPSKGLQGRGRKSGSCARDGRVGTVRVGPPRGCWAALPAGVSPHQGVKGTGSLRSAICSVAARGWQGPAREGLATVACRVPCLSARCLSDPRQGCHSSQCLSPWRPLGADTPCRARLGPGPRRHALTKRKKLSVALFSGWNYGCISVF